MNRRSGAEPASQTLRERIRETTTQGILAAAEEVFADAGLHAAHMGEIAARAGVSVGTLYNHFQDREALLAGLMQARRGELMGGLDEAIRGSAGDPFRVRLRAALVALLGHAERHRKFVHIILQREIGRYHQTFPEACGKSNDTMKELYARVDKLMKQGLREKALRPEQAELAVVFLLGMVRALIIRDALGYGRGIVDQVDRLLDLFLNGAGVNDAAAVAPAEAAAR